MTQILLKLPLKVKSSIFLIRSTSPEGTPIHLTLHCTEKAKIVYNFGLSECNRVSKDELIPLKALSLTVAEAKSSLLWMAYN